MKWINSRRFVVCLVCLAIMVYAAVFRITENIVIVSHLVPVLVAFMGATTIEKASEEFGKMRRRKDNDEDD